MFGIKRMSAVMCYSGSDAFQFCSGERIRRPVMIGSPTEIDNLCLRCIDAFNLYDLVVFEFTEEQEEKFLIMKLRGY